MKRLLVLIIVLSFSIHTKAQSDINNYKYVVVPLKYDFLKGKNTYRLNTFTKHMFKKNGFDVYFDEEQLPDDLFKDRCLAMYADILQGTGGFRQTKLQLILKDCYGDIIYTSVEGSSGENNYEKAHHEALRASFNTFEIVNYTYIPKKTKEDTKEQVATKANPEPVKEIKEPKVKQSETIVVESKADNETLTKSTAAKMDIVYYAQPVNNGYQIVDATPKVVMILLHTDSKDIYIVKDKNAVVFKKSGKWIYSENDGAQTKSKQLNIKF